MDFLRFALRFIAGFAGLTCPLVAAAATPPPNILWLIIEDACPDFGCYGNREVRTPHIDAFRQESRLYANAFAVAPICSVSRTALMTGRYPTSFDAHNHRSHRGDGFKRPPDVRLITERLREAGYFTVNVRTVPPELGFAGTGKTDWNFFDDGKAFESNRWSDLKAHQPFYAQLNFEQTHRPYYRAKVNPTDPAAVTLPPYLADDATIRADWAAYLDELGSVDEKVGAVLALLDREGLRENTVVFLFADHGREDFRGKYYGYEQGVHVPLLVRWPSLLAPGSASNELVSLLDVHATSLALAGVQVTGLDGAPFVGPDQRRREFLVGLRDRIDETPDRIRSVREARFKFYRNFHPERPYLQPMAYAEVTNPTYNRMRQLYAAGALTPDQAKFMAEQRPAEELYDLSEDPFELHNLAAEANSAATLVRLRARLDDWMKRSDFPQEREEDPAFLQSEMEKLDASVKRMRQRLKLEQAPAIDSPVTRLATRGLIRFSDSFAQRPNKMTWAAVKGRWAPGNGSLEGIAFAEEKNEASITHEQLFQNAVIQFELRLDSVQSAGIRIENGKQDAVRVAVTRSALVVTVDRSGSGGDAVELGRRELPVAPEQWHTVLIEMIEGSLLVSIDRGHFIRASHALIERPKAGIGFTVAGGAGSFRNVRIWDGTPNKNWKQAESEIFGSSAP